MELGGFEPPASHMRSEHSTTELQPLYKFNKWHIDQDIHFIPNCQIFWNN